ncbi:MAG: hypothetical protein ABIR18_07305 [Chitinophagaceae bacterium]
MTLTAPRQSFLSRHFNAIVLFCCWAIVQSFLFYKYGIQTDLEAAKYIFEADNLLKNGTVSTANYWLYITQISLIAIVLKLKTGFFLVYLVQLFFNWIATLVFYRFLLNISNKLTGLILTLFLIFNTPIQTFNSFLQTESLFYSFTIIFSCYLLQIQKLTTKTITLLFLLLLLVCFTRPTGLLFVPGIFLYLFFKFARSLSTLAKVSITIIGSILFLFFLNAALGSGGELDFMLPYRDERIICGVPTLTYLRDVQTSDNPNSVFGLLYYITHNAGQFTRLALLRSKAFFGLARPYYSNGHNLYLYLYFFPFYLLMLFSLRKWFVRNKYILLYCITVIAVTWLSVILTCDDWHNRFFLSVVPYIYILSAPAVQTITDKLKTNDSKRSI